MYFNRVSVRLIIEHPYWYVVEFYVAIKNNELEI